MQNDNYIVQKGISIIGKIKPEPEMSRSGGQETVFSLFRKRGKQANNLQITTLVLLNRYTSGSFLQVHVQCLFLMLQCCHEKKIGLSISAFKHAFTNKQPFR